MRFISRGIIGRLNHARRRRYLVTESRSFCAFYHPPDPKSRAKVPRSFPRSVLFHSHVCRRRCPCTMVHVISGEWLSPDAYTNSFSVPLSRPPATLRGVCPPLFRAPSPPSNSFQHFPLVPALFLRLHQGRPQWRRGFVIVPRDRKSDAKAVAKAGRCNTLMRLRSPHSPFRGPSRSPSPPSPRCAGENLII